MKNQKLKIDYDYCIVGSSPICLHQANNFSKKGGKVIIIDERKEIGGAWQVRDLFGCKNIEIGCHLILPSYKVYDLLEQQWGVNLIKMKPAPMRIINNKKYYFHQILPLIYQRIYILKNLINKIKSKRDMKLSDHKINSESIQNNNERKIALLRKIFNVIKHLFNLPHFIEVYNLKGKEFLYPKNGTYEMISKASKTFSKQGIKVIKGIKVINAIEHEDRTVKLKLSNNTSLVVKNLIVTSQTCIDFIQKLKYNKLTGVRQTYKQHLILLIDKSPKKIFSYVEFLDSKILIRASDVTNSSKLNSGERILCLELVKVSQDKNLTEFFLSSILNELLKNSLINPNANIKSHYLDNHIYIFGSNNLEKKLSKFNSIKFLKTTNLGSLENIMYAK